MITEGEDHMATVSLPGLGGPQAVFRSSSYIRDASVEIEIGGMKALVRREDLAAITKLFPAAVRDTITEDAARTLKDLRSMLGLTR